MGKEKSAAIKETAVLFWSRLKEVDLFKDSLNIAYYVTLSFFPILITISTLIPLFHIDINMIARYLDSLVPEPILNYVLPFVTNFVTTPQFGVFSISLLIAIWYASRCLTYIQEGIDLVYGIEKARMQVTTRIFSVIAFIAITFVLVGLMILFTFQQPITSSMIGQLDSSVNFINLYALFKWVGTFVSLFAFFSVLYYVVPSLSQKFRNVMPGALLSSGLVLLMVNLFSIYLRFASSTLTAYGVLSSLFILLIWIRMLAFIVLFGSLLNAVLFERKYGKPTIRKSRFDDWLRRIVHSITSKFKIKK